MKTEHKAIVASIGFGVFFWIADAVLDTLFFYEGPFIELLMTDVPPHELYIRCVGLAGFVVFGILMSSVLAKHRRAEEARAREEAELRATLYSIGDAVIATDVEGRVTRINPVAERLTGWAEEEAVGRPLEEVFPIVNEETHQPVENPVARVLREGSIVGLANHTLLISRDGRESPIADAAAPILDAQEDITGVVLVFRDQTDERLTQRLTQTRLSLIEYAAHHTLEELLTRAVDEVSAYVNSPIGFYHFVDPDQKTLSWQQWSTRTLEKCCQAEDEGMHYRIDEAGVWADCVREKRPAIHNDYASLPNKKGMPEGHTTVIRELVVPVMREEKVVAILGVGNKPVDYTEHDAEIVSYLADVTWEIARQKRAEETLRESEKKYRNLFENAPVGIFHTNFLGQPVAANAAMARMLGLDSPEEALAHYSYWIAQLYVDPERREEFLQKLQAKGSVENFIYQANTADGRTVWLSMNARAESSPGDSAFHIEGFTTDITDQVEAEERLREALTQLEGIKKHSPDLITMMDRGGRYLMVNQATADLLGREPEQIVGRTFTEVLPPAMAETFMRRLETVFETEQPLQIEDDVPQEEGASIYTTTLFPVFDQNDFCYGVGGIARDITERVQVEEEREQLLTLINDQARQLRDVMSTVPEGVVLLDTEGRLILANPVAQRYLALLSDTPSGDTITHLGDRSLADLLTSPPSGMWHEVKEGTRTFEVISRPVATGPEPERWVMVIQDVTEERMVRRRTELQERLASVGQLAAGIAHDFNNLIAVIALYAQMGARDPNLPTKHQERSGIILEQTRRAKDLVQQVLDFSRRAVLDRQPMDLLLFLKEQVHLLERTIPEDIAIGLNYMDTEYLVSADPTRMQQVVMNLAVNARDAMPQGGQLIIELEHVQVEDRKKAPLPGMETGLWVRMKMRDTGEGIPADVFPHIFEPFFTTKASGEGTGLGLAQVWGILRQHEGFIDVESSEGEGTTFKVYLPALPAQQAERLHPASEELPQGEGQVILVVEDNATLRAALAESLELLNYEILETANGREALAILEQHGGRISLVLSDLVMPVMGGQALFHAMRSRNLTIPVIMLSGHPMESELENLQNHGLAGWMLKPPDMEYLSQLLARVLRTTREENE